MPSRDQRKGDGPQILTAGLSMCAARTRTAVECRECSSTVSRGSATISGRIYPSSEEVSHGRDVPAMGNRTDN